MSRKVLVICLDGCDPEYIATSPTPTLDQIEREGFRVDGAAVIPAVTNVNNTSIITGAFPKEHGITSNYWYDPKSRTGVYMEDHRYVLRPTLLERAAALGLSAALLTSKKKLLHLLAGAGAEPYRGAEPGRKGRVQALTAQEPPAPLVEKLGPAPDIYSAEINLWLLKAARQVIQESNPDVMYVSTTDYVQHMHAPGEEAAVEHTARMDELIGEIIAADPDREVYVTADHGMRQMERGVDLERVLREAGIEATFQPIIKDRYVVHHNNLAGVAYLFFDREADQSRAVDVLEELPEVEGVYVRGEAASAFGLHPDRIGDLFVLGAPGVVFGSFDAARTAVNVRSHGSRHESRVPIYAYNASIPRESVRMNLDIVRLLRLESPRQEKGLTSIEG